MNDSGGDMSGKVWTWLESKGPKEKVYEDQVVMS